MTLQETLATIAKSGLPLQGKLDALKFEFDNNLAPPAAVEVLHRATDELIASGAQSRALKAGDVAPECSYGIGFFLPCEALRDTAGGAVGGGPDAKGQRVPHGLFKGRLTQRSESYADAGPEGPSCQRTNKERASAMPT